MSGMDVLNAEFSRPPNAAARLAALKDRLNAQTRQIGQKGEYDTKTLDTLVDSIKRWLSGLEGLADPALERKKLGCDERSSSNERVHKIPLAKEHTHNSTSAVDIRMDEAPPVVSGISLHDVSRPITPTKETDRPMTSTHLQESESSTPLSPPARKFENLEIRSIAQPIKHDAGESLQGGDIHNQPRATSMQNTTLPKPASPDQITTPSSQQRSEDDLTLTQATSKESTTQINPSPLAAFDVVIGANLNTTLNRSSSSFSASKKRRISNPQTVLDCLLEKRSKNAIFYDGATQKFFHNLVLEFSGQIQAIKKEKRFVMFAKDPACTKLLSKLDESLQEALKVVETASFHWLRGRPDWKQMMGLKTRLSANDKDIKTFKNLGWKMYDDDEGGSGSDLDADEGPQSHEDISFNMGQFKRRQATNEDTKA